LGTGYFKDHDRYWGNRLLFSHSPKLAPFNVSFIPQNFHPLEKEKITYCKASNKLLNVVAPSAYAKFGTQVVTTCMERTRQC
jgi:hypothetical protein